jgi:hypothetical protein
MHWIDAFNLSNGSKLAAGRDDSHQGIEKRFDGFGATINSDSSQIPWCHGSRNVMNV